MKNVALAAWITTVGIHFEYTMAAKLSTYSALAGILAGLILGYRRKSVSPPTALLLSGAMLAASVPLTRGLAIHYGASVTLVMGLILGLTGHCFEIPKSQSAFWRLAITLLTLGILDHFSSSMSRTSFDALVGLVLITLGVALGFYTHWLAIALLPVVLSLIYYQSFDWISDTRAIRYSLISTPNGRLGDQSQTLFANGQPKFIGLNEQRTHSCATSVAIDKNSLRRSLALVIFGGDGLIARNLLAINSISHITIVEPDKQLAKLGKDNSVLRAYNLDALRSPRTELILESPWKFLKNSTNPIDAIFVNLPDPNSAENRAYYTHEFIELIKKAAGVHSVITLIFSARTPTNQLTQLYASFDGWLVDLYEDNNSPFLVARKQSEKIQHTVSSRCRPTSRIALGAKPPTLKDIMTLGQGGEEKAQRLLSANAARLSLPR